MKSKKKVSKDERILREWRKRQKEIEKELEAKDYVLNWEY